MPVVFSETGAEAGNVPGVVIGSGVPVLTAVVQAGFEYTVQVTVPVATSKFGPNNVAVSVTAVPAGTLIAVPTWPPPDNLVLSDVCCCAGVTVSSA